MIGRRVTALVLGSAWLGCGPDTTLMRPWELESVPEAPAEVPDSAPLAPAAGCRADVWPAFGERDVAIGVAPELYFTEPVDAALVADSIAFTRLDDGSAVPFEVEVLDALSVRLLPEHELAFWQSYSLEVSGSALGCEGVLGTFSTPAPEFLAPPLRTAAALDIARKGDVVYSTSPTFHGLQVHRIQGTELELVGDVHWPEASNAVRVLGDRGYVPAGAQGVVILDLSQPEAPRVIGRAGVPGGASDVEPFRSGERELLAAAAGSEGVVVMDVSDPERAALVSRFDVSGARRNSTVDVDLDGWLLAAADGSNGLYALDLSDPADPQLVGRNGDASALRVQVAGDRLYALYAGWARVRSYSVAQLADELFEWNTCGQPCGLFSVSLDLLDRELFASTSQGGVIRVDAAPDGTLTQASGPALRVRSATQSVLAAADATLVGEVGGLGLFTPDGSGPFGFDPNGHGDARAVAVRGHYAYVAASFAGLQVFDIVEPLAPRWVGRVDTPGMATAIDHASARVSIDGDVLVLSDGRAGVSLYTLADPEVPALWVSFPEGADRFDDVALGGGRAYACNDNAGIERIDYAEGSAVRSTALAFDSPAQHSCHSLLQHPTQGLLYMGDLRGLGIYAQAPDGALSHVSEYVLPLAGGVGALALAGDRLIAASTAADYTDGSSDGSSTRLHVLDLSDPSAPRSVWYSEPLGAVSSLVVAGNTLFVGGGTELRIYDLSRAQPELEGSVATQSTIRHLLATPDAVYVAQTTGGLGVLRTGPLPLAGQLPPRGTPSLVR
jgi:hypothetical protein